MSGAGGRDIGTVEVVVLHRLDGEAIMRCFIFPSALR